MALPSTVIKVGTCHWCGLPVTEHDTVKIVLGDMKTMWHMPYCFWAESADPNSPWYDDPTRFLEPAEPDIDPADIEPYEELPDGRS